MRPTRTLATMILAFVALGTACSTSGGNEDQPGNPADNRTVLATASYLRLCGASAQHVDEIAAQLATSLATADPNASGARTQASDLAAAARDLAGTTTQNTALLQGTAPTDATAQEVRTQALALYGRCSTLASNARTLATAIQAADASQTDPASAQNISDTAAGLSKDVAHFTDNLQKP